MASTQPVLRPDVMSSNEAARKCGERIARRTVRHLRVRYWLYNALNRGPRITFEEFLLSQRIYVSALYGVHYFCILTGVTVAEQVDAAGPAVTEELQRRGINLVAEVRCFPVEPLSPIYATELHVHRP
jgi:hypothetical protein